MNFVNIKMPAASKHLKYLLKKKTKDETILLAKWQGNQLYYLVDLLRTDAKKDRYLVVYEDETESWTSRADLHLQLYSLDAICESDDDIVCCVCDGGQSEPPNEIVLCDVCQQGYHQKCSKPQVRSLDGCWSCQTCLYIMGEEAPTPDNDSESRGVPDVQTPTKRELPQAMDSPIPSRDNTNADISATSSPSDLNKTTLRRLPMEIDEITDEQSSIESGEESIQKLENGATLEKMPPAIIDVAKAVVENDKVSMQTKEFVETVSDEPAAKSSKPTKEGATTKAAAPAKALPQPKAKPAPEESGGSQPTRKTALPKPSASKAPSVRAPRKAPAPRAA